MTKPIVGLQRDAIQRVLLDPWSDYPADVKAQTLESLLGSIEGLMGQVESATREIAEERATRDMLADILTRTAAALKGPPPPLTKHNWADLPAIAARLSGHPEPANG